MLNPTCLIPFKAKAWLDLKECKVRGERVDNKNIKKHKNDVFRLTQLITSDTKQALSEEIAKDMKMFLSEMENEDIDLKFIGVRGADKKTIVRILYQCYGLTE